MTVYIFGPTGSLICRWCFVNAFPQNKSIQCIPDANPPDQNSMAVMQIRCWGLAGGRLMDGELVTGDMHSLHYLPDRAWNPQLSTTSLPPQVQAESVASAAAGWSARLIATSDGKLFGDVDDASRGDDEARPPTAW